MHYDMLHCWKRTWLAHAGGQRQHGLSAAQTRFNHIKKGTGKVLHTACGGA